MNIILMKEGLRIFRRSLRVKSNGVRQYDGNAKEICRQIVESCWNGEYFQVSTGNFCEFFIRDFGWCVDSYIKLGYKDEVIKTLDYALKIYSKNKLTTTITPDGKCVDVFRYSPDSLAFLIRSLRVSGAKDLVEKYKKFIIKEVRKFENLVMDKNTGMVTKKIHFSSIKDQSLRKSSTYDNIMAAMLARDLKKLGVISTLNFDDIKKNIKKELWNGQFFYDDMNKKNIVSGDANCIPFWTGVFTDKDMLKKSILAIEKNKLDYPFPLKYTKTDSEKKNYIGEIITKNYEGNSIWMHLGPLYVLIVKKIDEKKAKEYINIYTKLIEKHKNFLEVFDNKGNPFTSPFYYTDDSMSWAANYLTLL